MINEPTEEIIKENPDMWAVVPLVESDFEDCKEDKA